MIYDHDNDFFFAINVVFLSAALSLSKSSTGDLQEKPLLESGRGAAEILNFSGSKVFQISVFLLARNSYIVVKALEKSLAREPNSQNNFYERV